MRGRIERVPEERRGTARTKTYDRTENGEGSPTRFPSNTAGVNVEDTARSYSG